MTSWYVFIFNIIDLWVVDQWILQVWIEGGAELEFCHSGWYMTGFYGVMVSTMDFESSDPSANLGRTFSLFSSNCTL